MCRDTCGKGQFDEIMAEELEKTRIYEEFETDISPRHAAAELAADENERYLFIRCGSIIEKYRLHGVQHLGRTDSDICIKNPFVSRRHGVFETVAGQPFYTADKTTNGIRLNDVTLEAGQCVKLTDGDELTIPNFLYNESDQRIVLTCAFSDFRISFWETLMDTQFDALTHLLTRKVFTERFEAEQGEPFEDGERWLFLLDVDRFKEINDSYGHEAGDEAIRVLSEFLLQTVGDGRQVCRWGGDEFIGMLCGDIGTVLRTLEELNRALFSVRIADTFSMSVSIGLCAATDARNPNGMPPLEMLVRRADNALYQAKQEGRGRVVVWRGE